MCNVKYEDFIVWTESGMANERTKPDRKFYENGAYEVEHSHIYCLLTEVINDISESMLQMMIM